MTTLEKKNFRGSNPATFHTSIWIKTIR